jgi:hypothetical protein
MSRQAYVHSASVPKKREQSTIRWRIPVVVIGLTALVLVALAAWTVTPAGMPTTLPKDGDSLFAANPELMVVRRYTLPAQTESSLLAANPELMVVRRYTSPAQAESSLLAANPELIIARRNTRPAASESSFLAANPEVIIARRYGSW